MLDNAIPSAYIHGCMDPALFACELQDRGLLTQSAAGAALGVDQATISRWLNGERKIPPVVRVALRAIPRTAQVTRQTKRGRNGKANTRKK